MTYRKPTWLLIGTSGRVGGMLFKHWFRHPPVYGNLVCQLRQVAEHKFTQQILSWSPLETKKPLLAFSDKQGAPAVIFGFAGVTPASGVDLSINALLTEAILSAAYEAGVPRVLLASSSAVYGAGSDHPFRETDPTKPANEYGHSKLDMEVLCGPWRDRGLEICCLRIGNVAGADALLLNARNATSQNPLRIDQFRDGSGPLRSYIGPASLAEVLESLANHTGPLPELLNLASPFPTLMSDLAVESGRAWTWQCAPKSAHQNVILDCTRLMKLHSFSANDSSPSYMIKQLVDLQMLQ